jgi:hypothetical protein
MMLRRAAVLVSIVAVLLGTAGSASAATPIAVGDGWHSFTWVGGNGAPITQNPFTFFYPGFSIVTVTDAFCAGDVFSLTDNGRALGSTSSVPVNAACNAPSNFTPDSAMLERSYSHSQGNFILGPGPHALSLRAKVSPFGSGGAFLRVDPLFG